MKLILTLLFIYLLTISSFAQKVNLKQKINLQKQTYIIKQIFNEIQKQTGTELSYTSQFNTDEKIRIKSTTASLDHYLEQCINTQKFRWVLDENKIFIIAIPLEEQTIRISGFIYDADTGESLINANIYNPNNHIGTVSNNFGFFSFKQQKLNAQVRISYVGYEDTNIDLSQSSDTVVNIKLKAQKILNEVKVLADENANNINHLFLSTYNITAQDLNKKSVMGEDDFFRNLLYLPGVQSANEASSGLIVRSGSPDQNLVLLDDVPVYYQSHLLGLFSVFNPDAIHQARLIKGGFPAQYGGRISSVLDIRMKDGNNKRIEGNFSIGLLTTKLNIRGPIIKEKTSFNLSLRRSYLDLISSSLLNLADSDVKFAYYFGDLNFKLSHKFSNRDKLYLSTYWGGDLAKLKAKDVSLYDDETQKSTNKVGWGNFTNSLRWNHVYNDKLFGNTSLILSRYTYLVKDIRENKDENNEYKESFYHEFYSGIRDYSIKSEFDYIPQAKYYYKFGLEANFHRTKPGSNIYRNAQADKESSITDRSINALELALYFQNQTQWNKKLLTNFGFRFTSFMLKGENYASFEPRLTAQYRLNSKLSLNTGYSMMSQYMHLITSSTLSLPTDVWLPVGENIKPIRSHQFNMGSIWQIDNQWLVNSELFYKYTKNTLEFSENSYLYEGVHQWSRMVEAGKGWSTGFELLIKKHKGNTQGHLAYTLAKSAVEYKYLNKGKAYPSPYDRRHDLSIQVSQKLSSKIDININWILGSGLPLTIPNMSVNTISPYQPIEITETPVFSERNSVRMPNYHRMDISINFKKKKKRGTRVWNLSFYNIYNRKNASYVYLQQKYTDQGKSKYNIKQLSFFGFIPSVSYSYQF
ncbi:TonB-dependent receptor [Ancylomarina sp. YFZ004]